MPDKIEIRKVPCAKRLLEYQLTRKQVKNINLRVKPDGQIRVSANGRVPADFIDGFIREKQEYIIRALEQYEENRKQISTAPRQYVSGESYAILGKNFRLEVIQGQPESVSTDGISIFLTVQEKENQKRKEKLLNQWLNEQQVEVFRQICQDTYPIFKKYGVAYPIVKIRTMISRWGSCQPVKGIITLNARLLEAPRSCIEYVVLHEFAHFIHPNHSKEFYAFVAMLMPDYKERKKELEKIKM